METTERGLTFRSDILDGWKDITLCVISDASHAQEVATGITESGEYKEEPCRSQGGRVLMLASLKSLATSKVRGHVISYNSTTIKRACRSTVQAETYNLSDTVEEADRIRAGIADLHGMLDHKQWEASAAAFMPNIWFTDCRSARDSLSKSVLTKMADKRLMTEIASLRQNLWREPGELVGNPATRDLMPTNATDRIRWIDTDVMIADPLTKSMEADKLQAVLDTNIWDISQPIESVAKKRAKQLGRRKRQETITRVDYGVKTFQMLPEDATIDWSEVQRRTTLDALTGDELESDFKIQSRTQKYLVRELPHGPRDIRTEFYYTPAEGIETEGLNVQSTTAPGTSSPGLDEESYQSDDTFEEDVQYDPTKLTIDQRAEIFGVEDGYPRNI